MFNHTPVLLNKTIEMLNILPNGKYVDCTTGGAGHSLEIAKNCKKGKLVCIDKDLDALTVAKDRMSKYKHIDYINGDFFDIKIWINSCGISQVDGILADLGVSSYQIDTPERGFSYMKDGPLDMRMNKRQEFSAMNVVNDYTEEQLKKIMYTYGEEKNSSKIAKKIVELRQKGDITTTFQLKEIIKNCYPKKFQAKPAIYNKVFQAIRIEVNGELYGLEQAVEDMIESLASGGRLAIITFHTLEDRIVKNIFKTHSTDCLCPGNIPICVCNHKADCKLLTKKPLIATEEELLENRRSASAKLRVIQKL